MFSDFLNKITNTLEAIDTKAATTAGVLPDQFENSENGNYSENENDSNAVENDANDTENPQNSDDINFIREEKNIALSELHAAQIRMQSLMRKNMRLEDEYHELYEKNRNSETTIAKLEAKLKQVQSELLTNKKKQIQFEENYGQNRTNFDKMRDTLEGDLTDTKTQLSSIKHEYQVSTEKLQKLEQDLKNKGAEIAQLEEENSQLRNKLLEGIASESGSDKANASQCEMLESEVHRLKEKNAKIQQKANQSEAIIKEIEIQKQREIGDFKKTQTSLETELFKYKMRLDELTHEISLIKSRANAEREEYEAIMKEKMEQEREEFKLELNRTKERAARQISQLKKNDSNSLQDQLNISLATIESLKSEKAALLLNLESAALKTNQQRSMSVNVSHKRSSRFIPLTSMIKSKKSFAHKMCTKIDKAYTKGVTFIHKHPLLRAFLLLLLFVMIVLKIVRLF